MVVLHLAVRAVAAVKIARSPAFKIVNRGTQKVILERLAVRSAQAVAVRSIAITTIGVLYDPYNRVVVPRSRGALVATDTGVGRIVDGEIDGFKELSQIHAMVILDPEGSALGVTSELFKKASGAIQRRVESARSDAAKQGNLAIIATFAVQASLVFVGRGNRVDPLPFKTKDVLPFL